MGKSRNSDKNKFEYSSLGQAVGKLVEEKQEAYGDSFGRAGDIMRVLYPDGVPLSKYDDMLAIVRILDKLFRIATHGAGDLMDESPARDIAGYALLMTARHDALKRPE